MQKLFNRILVPVDFSVESGLLLTKAAALAVQFKCQLILLAVASDTATDLPPETDPEDPLTLYRTEQGSMQSPLDELAGFVRSVTKKEIPVQTVMMQGGWNPCMIRVIRDYSIDLVVQQKPEGNSGAGQIAFSPDRITAETHVPVISLPLRKQVTPVMQIIIPVTDSLPVRKLLYGIYLGTFYSTSVQLLGVLSEKNKTLLPYYLEKSFSLIRQNCELQVEMDLVRCETVDKAIRQYAINHPAGIYIVHPGVRRNLNNYFMRWWEKLIGKRPDITLLTIA